MQPGERKKANSLYALVNNGMALSAMLMAGERQDLGLPGLKRHPAVGYGPKPGKPNSRPQRYELTFIDLRRYEFR